MPVTLTLATGNNEQLMLWAGLLAAIIVVAMWTRRRTRAQLGGEIPTSRERLAELTAARGVRDDMNELLAELQGLSRQINAQIDTKFAKLERAIADADRRIEHLERLNATRPGPRALDVTVGDDTPEGDEPPESDAQAAPPAMSRRTRVYELADAGKSSVEIAQALGQTPGEIELILSLRGR